METGHRDASALRVCLDYEQEQHGKRLKVDPAYLDAKAGAVKEFGKGVSLERVKQEPNEQPWQGCEVQRQPLRKVVETPSPEEGRLEVPRQQGHVGCSQSPLDVSQQLRGHEVSQLQSGTIRGPQDTSLALNKTVKIVKDEFPGEVGHEEVILGEEAVSWDAERQKFREFIYYEAVGPRLTSYRLWTLCRQWLQPEKRTKEQILERVILEQFLAILPQDMQNWVKQQRPDSCPRAVALAEGFLLLQEQKTKKEETHFPKGEEPPLDSCQRPRSQGIKQEDDSGPTMPGDRTVREIKGENFSEEDSLMEATAGGSARGRISSLRKSALLRLPKEEPGTICNPSDGFIREIKEEDPDEEGSLVDAPATPDRRAQGNIAFPCGSASVGLLKEEPGTTCNPESRSANVKTAAVRVGKEPGKSREVEPEGLVPSREEETRGPSGQGLAGEQEEVWTGYGKTFHWKSILTPCKEPVTDWKIYQCCACGKHYDAKSIRAHQKMHTGEKLYECIYCGRTFSQRAQFESHEKIHTGVKVQTRENMYICVTCGKSFAYYATLVAHKRTHGEDDSSMTD